jgi:hypothetical protein
MRTREQSVLLRRTVRTADHPASGPDRPQGNFLCSTYAPCFLVEVDEAKSYTLSLMQVTGYSIQ